MFSKFFKKTTLTVHMSESPVESFMRDNKTTERVQLYLGHTVQESPVTSVDGNSPHNTRERMTKDGIENLKYFQEDFMEHVISPCESYVSVSDSAFFDPIDIDVSRETMDTFARNPLDKSLRLVPGIDSKNYKILREQGVNTTHQLIGHFLLFKTGNLRSDALANKFYHWLESIGVCDHRATITASIAQKIGTWVPGFYDKKVYGGHRERNS